MDDKEILSRYIFDGNLKIPVHFIKSADTNMQSLIITVFSKLRDRLLSCFQYNENCCITYPLSINRTLYIDYRNKKLNFYIKDDEKKEFNSIINFDSTPMTVFFKNGEETTVATRIVGAKNEEYILAKLKSNGYIDE